MYLIYPNSSIIILFIISILISTHSPSAGDKHHIYSRKPTQIAYSQHVLKTGGLHNYISNNTYDIEGNDDHRTFLIVKDDLEYLSMQWLEGGYAENHYLYTGILGITYQGNPIRFSTQTSADFKITKLSPYEERVSFSMSDELADTLRVGIKCLCNAHGYSDISRQDVTVYKYQIINKSGRILSGVYCGLQMDGDISAAGGGSGSQGFWRDDIPDCAKIFRRQAIYFM
jgi:hypothetical protein